MEKKPQFDSLWDVLENEKKKNKQTPQQHPVSIPPTKKEKEKEQPKQNSRKEDDNFSYFSAYPYPQSKSLIDPWRYDAAYSKILTMRNHCRTVIAKRKLKHIEKTSSIKEITTLKQDVLTDEQVRRITDFYYFKCHTKLLETMCDSANFIIDNWQLTKNSKLTSDILRSHIYIIYIGNNYVGDFSTLPEFCEFLEYKCGKSEMNEKALRMDKNLSPEVLELMKPSKPSTSYMQSVIKEIKSTLQMELDEQEKDFKLKLSLSTISIANSSDEEKGSRSGGGGSGGGNVFENSNRINTRQKPQLNCD